MRSNWNDLSLQGNSADNLHLQLAIGMTHNNNMAIEARIAVIPQYDWTKVEPLPGQAEFLRKIKEQL